uniref:Cytochrome P450 720B n=2 Tax=Pinus subgen. Pinus TaxID=139271 RepID=A0A9E7V392_PINEL|nr:cytochrome P450 720B [Pinus elliottii]
MADQISLLLVVFTAAVALLHLIYRWWNAQTGQRKTHTEKNQAVHLPPGSTGWPLIGETYSYYRSMSSNRPRQFIDDREKRYDSDIFVSHLFGSQAVVSADPQFNKYVLQNEGRLFQAQYPKALKALMGDYGLLSVHGNLQRKLHGIAVNLLSFERLKFDFMVEIQNLVHSTLDRWVDEKEIFLQNECHQMVLNLMAKQLLDLSPSKETNEICKLFVDYTNAMIAIPIKIPGSTYAKGLKTRKVLIRKIFNIIKERRNNPHVVHNDLLQKLMEEGSLSDEIICDFILFLLFAGHETSSRAMTFAIKFLTSCPKALTQMKEEHDVILKAKGGHKKLEWDDYKSMKFTQCVINETLRLDILIPKGWVVCVFSSATHLDEKFHNEALTFNPWRWELDQDVSNNHLFSPFGGGARLCPGSHLARLELALFLHIFITRFRWEALDDEHPSYFPLPYLAKGFPMRLYNRE